MGSSCMKVCSCLCCIVLVITNIIAMIIGALLTIIGVFLTFGFSLFKGFLQSTVASATSSITSSVKSNTGVDLDIYSLLENIGSVTGALGAALLVVGIVIILLGCFGCCGACCKTKVCLIIYVVFVAAILVAQLIVVLIWFSNAAMFTAKIKTAMEESVRQYTGIGSKNIQSLLQNMIQIFIGCCGVNNGTDFSTMSPNWNRTSTVSSSGYSFTYNLTYPETCCKFDLSSFKPTDTYCPYNNTNSVTSNYQKGCHDELVNKYFTQYFQLLFYALGGILGFQVLLITGALIIYRASDDSGKVKPR